MNDRRERIRSLLLLEQPSFSLPAGRQGRNRENSSVFMNNEKQVESVERKVNEMLNECPGYFLVEISVRPTNNLKVFVDADQGATIDQLSKLNRALYKWVEENLFPNGDFSIEVSSPGLDEPLKLNRQYLKNIGRFVEVLLKNGIKKEGRLLSVSDEEIVVEEEKGKGKKKELIEHRVSKPEIKSTKIQIRI
ncbi:MAG TPA: ribosome maturation factor [Chitinophagaceae bacterium]|nr:ribosome maturation factor [Chitinophagaceae bacterium]